MYEYHVDMHSVLLNYVGANTSKYGGNFSVRMDVTTKPLMIIGQDKSTYHQFLFLKKNWKVPTGMHFILPTSEGEILTISGFQSCEFRLGLKHWRFHKWSLKEIECFPS